MKEEEKATEGTKSENQDKEQNATDKTQQKGWEEILFGEKSPLKNIISSLPSFILGAGGGFGLGYLFFKGKEEKVKKENDDLRKEMNELQDQFKKIKKKYKKARGFNDEDETGKEPLKGFSEKNTKENYSRPGRKRFNSAYLD